MRRSPVLIAAAMLALSACATAPQSRTIRPEAYLPAPLALCSASGSNLPEAGADRVVRHYAPVMEIRGVPIARTPTDGCLSSGFGARNGGAGPTHKGIDLVTRTPKAVFAAADGLVEEALERRNFGLTVLIRHKNGIATRYAHLSAFAPGVKAGAKVAFGEEIGRTGKTGNAEVVHLHYEILVDGVAVNPLTVAANGATS